MITSQLHFNRGGGAIAVCYSPWMWCILEAWRLYHAQIVIRISGMCLHCTNKVSPNDGAHKTSFLVSQEADVYVLWEFEASPIPYSRIQIVDILFLVNADNSNNFVNTTTARYTKGYTETGNLLRVPICESKQKLHLCLDYNLGF